MLPRAPKVQAKAARGAWLDACSRSDYRFEVLGFRVLGIRGFRALRV